MAGPEKFNIVPEEKIINLIHINSGGFGNVFKGDHVDWGISVAVKILRDPTGPEVNRELKKEVKLMHYAQFDYIARLYGIYQQKEKGVHHLGIVMEYLENGSLDCLLKQVVPLPWALRFRILHEVALGMNYLHGLKPQVLHLDLKPSNVLLDENFRVKLTDFGLSRWKETSTRSRSTSSSSYGVGGTLAYKAPEAFDLNCKPQKALDCYSYGILTWSVVTGKEPYSDAVCIHSLVMYCVQSGQRPEMKLLPDDLPPELKDLMQLCWSQDPSERPHFRECVAVTRKVFEVRKVEVVQDIREVQDKLRTIRERTSHIGLEDDEYLDDSLEYQQPEHDSGLSSEQNPVSSSVSDNIPVTAEFNDGNRGTLVAQQSEIHQDANAAQEESTQQGTSAISIRSQEDSEHFNIRNQQHERDSDVSLQQNSDPSSERRSVSVTTDADSGHPARQEQHFVIRYFAQLVERVSCIDPILDILYSKLYFSLSEYSIIRSKRVIHDKVRETLLYLKNKGTDAMDQFYHSLRELDPYLVDDLLKDQG